jgi:hypothetical protein
VGCWPAGTWTVKLTKATTGSADSCATDGHEPTPLAQYEIVATATADPTTGDPDIAWTYTPQSSSDPNVDFEGKATGGGVGLCNGAFGLYDATGTEVWNLTPELNTDDMTLSGTAEYDLYGSDQWVGSD